jgi:copper chaperone NosL
MVFIAAALFIVSLKLPLWQMRLEAPQYRGEEALHVAVHPNALHGDLKELATLNQYIGVHVPPTLPQFKWLPSAILSAAILGLVTCCFGRSIRSNAMVAVPVALAIALAVAVVQANWQMRDIGHHRDHRTVLVGVQDFTPPFLGTTKIAQFEVSSALGWGAWLIGAAMTLQVTAAFLSRKRKASAAAPVTVPAATVTAQFKPQPALH